MKKLQSWFPISGVPVLLYHRLSKSRPRNLDSRKARYEIPFSDFRTHLERIRQLGYRILSVPEIRDESLSSSTGPAVGITFDDGFASDYEEAFPTLLAQGARAEFFLNTANVGKSEYLNWTQIREMHRGGMGIHSHGHSHAALSLLSVDSLRRELNTSRNLLEDKLGSSVEFIAAPYGLVNRRVIREALAAGYRAVCRSREWPAKPGNKCINRVTVYRKTSLGEFDDLLTCRPGPYIRRLMRSVAIYCPKRLVVKFQPKLLGVVVQEEPT